MISGTGIRVIAMGMVSIVFPYMFADNGPRFLLEVARGLQVPGSSHDARDATRWKQVVFENIVTI